ncbi:hypothetical protein HanXRQr2_Chr16g0760541 [Helianthus annuus]|uniref:Uncharacterized protein n=1 Tax=Helianthus annuus TaxID=4232 RepID=A0A9K3GYW5_HELAN|nr:hypothetical protein HanXRQr2_Chr16g0760541 [Helianthus annuus]KAJ0822165.1 hypothetical protein HanPSC8_Chr16g0728761 [Helianthus annuus]
MKTKYPSYNLRSGNFNSYENAHSLQLGLHDVFYFPCYKSGLSQTGETHQTCIQMVTTA